MDKCLGYRMNRGACAQFHGQHHRQKATKSFSWDPQHAYSVYYHGGAKLLNCHRLRAKNKIIPQDDTPCYHCYRLLQMFTTFFFLHFPFSRSKGGGGSWSFSKQQQRWCWETHWDLENGGPGLYKTLTARALSHLCLSLALGVCEKVMVMVLLGQSGFWDASLTLRPGSISDLFNGLEHGGLLPTASLPQNQHRLVFNTHLGTRTSRYTYTFLSPTDNGWWIWHPSLKPGSIFHFGRTWGVTLTHCAVTLQHYAL